MMAKSLAKQIPILIIVALPYTDQPWQPIYPATQVDPAAGQARDLTELCAGWHALCGDD